MRRNGTERFCHGIALKSPVLRWRGKESMAGALRRAAMNGGGIDRKHGNGMGMQWDVKIARALHGQETLNDARALQGL